MLDRLCNTIGVSGYESEISQLIFSEIQNTAADVKMDKVGNVICLKKGKDGRKKVIISAHMDEVGFQIIKKIDENKYRIKALGNIKTWNAIQQRVKSENSTGVIYANNEDQLSAHNYDNIYLSVIHGKEAKVGDVFTFATDFCEGDLYYSGKALDNRLACHILLELINDSIESNADIYFVFTTQEEIGMRGMRVAKTNIMPDLCINIDVSAESDVNSIISGEGVGIKISDSMSISTPELVKRFEKIALDNNIKYQLEVSDCGTSELIITNELDNGCEEIGISLPCKYLHSANSLVNKNDFFATKKYLSKIINSL